MGLSPGSGVHSQSNGLAKLSPFIGDFIAVDYSYYVVLLARPVSVVSSTRRYLGVFVRKIAQSITLAARGTIVCFCTTGREGEVHGQAFAFLIL